MTVFKLSASFITLALVALPHLGWASGSDAGGGARTGDAVAYQEGKRLYASRYACKECPLHDQKLDESQARQILSGNPSIQLSDEEAMALKVFLTKRFKLQ